MIWKYASQNSRPTQRGRFVLYGTHPNLCVAEPSFILGTLYAIGRLNKEEKI